MNIFRINLECFTVKMCSSGTNTFETAWGILALSSLAQHGVEAALVDVHTELARYVHLVAGVGQTPVAARHVLAGSVLAHVAALGRALVDVVPGVGEPAAVGTQEVVVRRPRGGAGGAGAAPPHPVGEGDRAAATGGLGNGLERRIDALIVGEHRVTETEHSAIRTGFTIGPK